MVNKGGYRSKSMKNRRLFFVTLNQYHLANRACLRYHGDHLKSNMALWECVLDCKYLHGIV